MLVSTPLGGDSEEEGVGDWGLSHILSTAAWGVKLKRISLAGLKTSSINRRAVRN